MLKPDKHLDPRFSVIHIGGLVIKALRETGMMTFNELLAVLMERTDEKVKEVYLPSLSFLFLLGKIQYHPKIDSFELVG
jgi:hypothetical protein